MRINYLKCTNLFLRGLSLISRFAIIIFFAHYLTAYDLGLYGLVVATVSYSISAVGFDFYTYSTRELAGTERNEWGRMLKSKFALFVVIYSVVFPFIFLIFFYEFLPWHIAPWFLIILCLEHLAQELTRILVAISEQLWASTILFLRSGAWAILVLPVMWKNAEWRSLDFILAAWSFGSALACLLGLYRLSFLGVKIKDKPIDFAWIKKGLRIALPLFIATLALRCLFSIDRYLVQAISGTELLGAYVLLTGIANSIPSFLDSGVFVFSYPKLIASYRNGDIEKFNVGMRNLTKQTFIVSTFLSLTSIALIVPLLKWLNKPIYLQKLDMFYWILISVWIFCLSMIPHYGLYARGSDRAIIISHIAGVLAFFPSVWLMSSQFGELSVPLALCLSFSLIMFIKLHYFLKLYRNYNNLVVIKPI